MKARNIIYSILAISSFVCCTREIGITESGIAGEYAFSAVFEQDTKSMLGEGNSVLWKSGDAIAIFDGDGAQGWAEGYTLGARYITATEGAKGYFNPAGGEGDREATPGKAVYYALTPWVKDAGCQMEEGIVTNWISNRQKGNAGDFPVARKDGRNMNFAIAKTIDPENIPFTFYNMVSLLKVIVPSELDGQIHRIGVHASGEYLGGDVAMCLGNGEPWVQLRKELPDGKGSAYTDIYLLPDNAENSITPNESTFATGTYYIAVKPGMLNNGFTVKYQSDITGTIACQKTFAPVELKRSKIYNLGSIYVPGTHPVAEPCEVSSSTVNFTWSYGDDAAAAIAKAWTVELYKDASLTEKVAGYEIPAGSSIWKSNQPKFCFAGLDQNTTYYFRAGVSGEDNWSNVVSATTGVFNLDIVTEKAKAGDLIAATDFHELMEGGETGTGAAAFGKNQNAFKDANADGTYMFSTANMSEGGLWASSSFKDWGYARTGGSANVYPHQGHVKLGVTATSSYLATPVLSAIDGTADVEVEFTAMVYPNATDQGKVTSCFIATSNGTFDGEHKITLSSFEFSNKAVIPMTDNTKWVTYKAELKNVSAVDHIIIGPNENGANTRFCISDVKVTVTKGSAPAATLTAAATEKSSSTVSFEFGCSMVPSEDIARTYELYLYSDVACQNELRHVSVTPATQKWEGRQPKFAFGGLSPKTTYYFKAVSGEAVSDVISSTTEDFTIVKMPSVAASVGDVILADDFRDSRDGGEIVTGASAYGIVEKMLKKHTDSFTINNNDGWKAGYGETSFADWGFMKEGDKKGGNFYSNQGHLKTGVTNDNSWIVTPQLMAIPEGKSATLEVEITMAAYAAVNDRNNVKTGVVGLTQGEINTNRMLNTYYTAEGATSNVSTFSIESPEKWVTYKVAVSNATSAHRLFFGSEGTGKEKRTCISDVKVKIIAIY